MIGDRLLLWRLRRGDKEALRAIYEKYRGRLMGVATAIVGSGEAAEDVLHDVFVNLAEKVVGLEDIGNLRAYLITCVANKARDRFRRRHGQVGLEAVGEIASDGPEAGERAARAETAAIIKEAIEKLPQEQREVVMLRLQGEMRFDEIAKLQEASSGTVRARYRYGIEKLRALMKMNGEVTR
jgi:RNA polymerase sigma-70 factor, ECF subfamily